MAPGLAGANLSELRALATDFDRAAERVQAECRNVHTGLTRAAWKGHYADRFRNEWQSRHARQLEHLASQLRTAATALRRHADDQQHASSAAGAPRFTLPRWPTLPPFPRYGGFPIFGWIGIVGGFREIIPGLWRLFPWLPRPHPQHPGVKPTPRPGVNPQPQPTPVPAPPKDTGPWKEISKKEVEKYNNGNPTGPRDGQYWTCVRWAWIRRQEAFGLGLPPHTPNVAWHDTVTDPNDIKPGYIAYYGGVGDGANAGHTTVVERVSDGSPRTIWISEANSPIGSGPHITEIKADANGNFIHNGKTLNFTN